MGLFTTYARIKGNTTYNGTNATWQSGMNMIDTVNDLLIPLAGNRNRTSGGLFSQGAYALYWASTPNGTNAYYLYFYSTNLHPQPSNNRAIGFSVRCFQNSLTP
ncbi:MAG: fibrobacter succinogenes major paralogous domain-containing protein [Candidatus Peribacteria bacterium]|nr:fibrobacter succinogenes major paralogous domain-containing protein [Candidatus Peribacteria bacterium]